MSESSSSLVPSLPAEPVSMTSVEMVAYINADREQQAKAAGAAFPSKGFAKLQHSHFLKKVPQVLGEEVSQKFETPLINQQNGQTYDAYTFPKREACLMAMSYSYELQAKVFDKMTAQEALIAALPAPVAAPALPAPNPLAEQAAGIATQALVQLHEATTTHAAQMAELLSQQARLIALLEQRPALPAPEPTRPALPMPKRITIAAWLDWKGIKGEWKTKRELAIAVEADYVAHGVAFERTRNGFGLFAPARIEIHASRLLQTSFKGI